MIKKFENLDTFAVGSKMINKNNALKGKMPLYKFVSNIVLFKLLIYNKKNFTDCHSGFWA